MSEDLARSVVKLVVFSLLPAVLFFGGAEMLSAMLDLDRPGHIVEGVDKTLLQYIRPDRELGWALTPNFSTYGIDGGTIKINSLGLRSPEVGPKRQGEFRILSLGESSTFGQRVSASATYSALLERFLQARTTSKDVTVINAGLPAYSSTQSLKYLKSRGLNLGPDLVLIYHEVNDYLPSVIRVEGMTELGILKTDKELYGSGSGLGRANGLLLEKSHFYRFLTLALARRKLEAVNRTEVRNPVLDIGLPDVKTSREAAVADQVQSNYLGRRVSQEERTENLEEFLALSKEKGFILVVIHPSYHESRGHECELTRFCREKNVLMLDAHPFLHTKETHLPPNFVDRWHPSTAGHRRLALGLTDFLMANVPAFNE